MSLIVQKLRLQRGWSQAQLAELSGLSTRTVQRIEGGHNATAESLKSLAAVFEVDFQELRSVMDAAAPLAPAAAPPDALTTPPETTMTPIPHEASSPTVNSSTRHDELQRHEAARQRNRRPELADLPDDEVRAFKEVRNLRGWYIHALQYVVVIGALFVLNASMSKGVWWVQWPALGWGIGLMAHGLSISKRNRLFGPDWERQQIEKRIGRKL
jgi:transcriptional regulator with XRE-family HTH domain